MPKHLTGPYLFDEQKSISTVKLREWGYLQNNSHKSGTVTWTTNGNKTGSIGIVVTMNYPVFKIRLHYHCDGKEVNYSLDLVSVSSNLGKGVIWYFVCPFTGVRCRKLHLIKGKFQHRSALPEGMYSKQCHSKHWRNIEKIYGSYFDQDKNYEQLYKKHFKKYYNGKPTKKYKRLTAEIDRADRFQQQI